MESMELKNLISSSETVDVYRVGDMAIKLFKDCLLYTSLRPDCRIGG